MVYHSSVFGFLAEAGMDLGPICKVLSVLRLLQYLLYMIALGPGFHPSYDILSVYLHKFIY